MKIQLLKIILSFGLLVGYMPYVKSQDSTKHNGRFYRITASSGMGGGRCLGKGDPGLAGSVEFELQNKYYAVSVGFHVVDEFQFLGTENPNLSISSADIMFCKILNKGKNYYSFGVGAGYVTNVTRGEYLYSDPGFFGNSYFQKVRSNGFGIPLLFKAFLVPVSYFGGGLSLYANINRHSFYSVTAGIQFGRLRNGKERPRAAVKQSFFQSVNPFN